MLRALHREDIPIALRLLLGMLRPACMAGMMFLLVRFEPMLRCSPLAAALLTAGIAAGEHPAPLVAGCLLGALRLPLGGASLQAPVSCALALIMELLLGMLPGRRRACPLSRAAAIAGLAQLLPALAAAGFDPLPSARALACALLAACSAPFMAAALEFRPGGRLGPQAKTGLALLFGGMIAGLYRICAPAAQICAALGALTPGGGAGAVAGVALGAGGGSPGAMLGLTLGGLVCGARLFTARWQRALALAGTAAAAEIFAGGSGTAGLWAGAAGILWLLVPGEKLRALDESFHPGRVEPCCPEALSRALGADTGRRLRALAEAFGEMADGCRAPMAAPDEQELILQMRARMCAGCPGYAECWAGSDNRGVRLLCRLIGEALERVDAPPGMRVIFSDGEIPPDIQRACRRGRLIPDRLGLLLRDFAEKRRSEIKRCATGQLMSAQFDQAGEILRSLACRQEELRARIGPRLESVRAALAEAGVPGCRVLYTGPRERGICVLRSGGRWTRAQLQTAGQAAARAMGGRCLPRMRGGQLCFIPAPRLRASAGTSCQSGTAGQTCGDSHMVRMLDESRMVLMLSDGMGSGERAARESAEALRLLWRFMDAGIPRAMALETVNQQLLMRSGEDMFATIDLCILNLNTGEAEFTKLAASRSFILRRGALLNVEGGRLPLGILERVQPGTHRMRLKPGDMIVMGSDGVMEAGETAEMEAIARANAARTPRQLAETLVREAGLKAGERRRDDRTCICVRVERAG